MITESETHFIDIPYPKKVDLFKKSDQLVGLKVICYERVVECHLDDNNNPIFKVRKLKEDDKTLILRERFKNVGKQWTNDDIKKDDQRTMSSEDWRKEVYQLRMMTETNGDIKKTSKKLKRTEKSVRIKLFFLDIIDENEVIWIYVKKIFHKEPKKTRVEEGKV